MSFISQVVQVVEIKDMIMLRTHCHIVVPSRAVIDSIVMFPLLSALAAFKGTIIPLKLWKHGSGSYPLDIAGETMPSSQVFRIELALSG